MRQGDLRSLAIKTVKQQASKTVKPQNSKKGRDAAAFVGEDGKVGSDDLEKVTYWLTPRQRRALKVLASQQGRGVSALLREIIDRFLE